MRHLILDEENNAESASSTVVRFGDSNRVIPIESPSNPGIIVNIASLIESNEKKLFFSLELFPNKRDDKLHERFFSEVARSSFPLFYSLTWHHDRSTDGNYLPVEILRGFPNNTLLHVAARKLRRREVVKILDDVLGQGKTNVFVLRGDDCTETGDFVHAVDLVKFMREHYGSKFAICVAGYPQMHPESVTKQSDLTYLKEKVDAGANFIISQLFFESEAFVDFANDCKSRGIDVPIIAGIFPFTSYKSLRRMAELCKIAIPRAVIEDLEPVRNNDEAVRAYGVDLARKLIANISETGAAAGFHLFTLNSASTTMEVCRGLFD